MIEKALTLSTAHMPDEEPDFGSIRVAPHQYGFIIFVADIDELALHVPQWLRPLYMEALNYECTLINFDADVSQDDRFKTYEW